MAQQDVTGNAGRLIDGNRLAELFESAAERGAGVLATVYRDAAHFARTAQEIEAEPVRHARWIPLENGGYCCSSCGHKTDLGFAPSEMIDPRDYLAYLDNDCGHCGARMDGGADNA